MFVKIDFNYNINLNLGMLKFTIFGFIVVYKTKISIKGRYIYLIKKYKTKIEEIDINSFKFKFESLFFKSFIKKIVFNNIKINMVLCSTNVFQIAVISEIINLFLNFIFANYKNINKSCEITNNINTGFRHNIFEIYIKISLMFVLIDFINALIKSFIGAWRKVDKKRLLQ